MNLIPIGRRAALMAGLLFVASAGAQVGKTELRFAQIIDQGGVNVSSSRELMLGASLVLDPLNARGGMFGRRVEVETIDNRSDPKRMTEIIGEVKQRNDLFGVFSIRSTADTVMLARGLPGWPIFASSSGADPVRKALPPNVLFVRTTWGREADRLMEVAKTVGIKRVALVAPEGPIGQAAQGLMDVLLKKHDLTLSGIALTPGPSSTDVMPAATKLAATDAQMVVVALAGPAADFMLAARRIGMKVPMYALSDAITPDFAGKFKGSTGAMVGFSSAFPSPWDRSLAIVRDYQAAMDSSKRGSKDYSFSSLEGYINARLLVEVLKRVGPDVTRERFIDTAQSLKIADFGGLGVDFSKGNTALTFAEVFVITSTGRVIR